jgi:polar amino acid transport system ATP-binding protein
MILEVTNLHKSFKGIPVLKGLNFSMNKGDILGVLGSSGGGKTTLLRCINNLEKADRGSINIGGRFLCKDSSDGSLYSSIDELNIIRRKLGLVFQNFNLFPHLTVLENIIESPVNTFKEDKEKAVNNAKDILESLNLIDKIDSYPFELSGGQKQRAAIGRALALNPEILCFDEPTSALDPELTEGVVKIIQNLSKKIGILLITHDISFAKKSCSRIIFIDKGEIIEDRLKDDFFNSPIEQKSKNFINA